MIHPILSMLDPRKFSLLSLIGGKKEMNYPNWLEKSERELRYYLNGTESWVPYEKLLDFAKDAWALAYNAGAEGSMTPGEFCAKYADDMPSPNDGAGI